MKRVKEGETYKDSFQDNGYALVKKVEVKEGIGLVVIFNDELGRKCSMNIEQFSKEYDVSENVNSSKPAHYDTAIDTIDFMKANFSREAVEGFMRGNAIKYLQRAGKKGDKLDDLRKSAHYLQMLIEWEEEGKE